MRSFFYFICLLALTTSFEAPSSAKDIQVYSRVTTFGARIPLEKSGEIRVKFFDEDLTGNARVYLTFGFFGQRHQKQTDRKSDFSWKFRSEKSMDRQSDGSWLADIRQTIYAAESETSFHGLNFYLRIVSSDGSTSYLNGNVPTGFYSVAYKNTGFIYLPEQPEKRPVWIETTLEIHTDANESSLCGRGFTSS